MSAIRIGARALAALATVLALSIPAPAHARAGTTTFDLPDGVHLEAVTVNGSGCKQGNATVEYSQDHTKVRISFKEYYAEAGDGADRIAFRRNCQFNLRVTIPEGLSYGVKGAATSGYVYLADGIRATQRTSYYFAGTSPTAQVTHTFTGPVSRSWETKDEVDAASMVWSPCGLDRNLNVNSEVRVLANNLDPWSFIWVDAVELDARTDFVWKKC
jgi:hypothetical protein